MTILTDGAGTGDTAKIDNTNRLFTRGITSGLFEQALLDGEGFFISSGIQTLTSANISYLLYTLNNDNRNLLVTLTITNLGTTADGVGDVIVTAVINPTAGTLVSAGSTGVAANSNLGSAVTADLTILTGVEGLTITDGIKVPSIFPYPARTEIANVLIVPKGKSVAFGATPPPGNTSMNVQFGLQVLFLEDL